MLQSLHIVNFAIIEDSWIDFEKGVTVFTGETGSGKSILMDALAILLGRRASVELIRNGKEFFRVEGVFTAEPEILPAALEELGIEAENGEILISRKMNKNGRGICTVNDALCTVKQLEKLGRRLVKIHEQNENENLLSADFCRYLVDHFSEQLTEAFREYEARYRRNSRTFRTANRSMNGGWISSSGRSNRSKERRSGMRMKIQRSERNC